MAIRFSDGFDYYTSSTYGGQIWTSYSTAGFVAGRFGGSAALLGGPLVKTIDSQQTWIICFAMRIQGTIGVGTAVEVKDGSTLHLDLRIDAVGHLQVTRNGTVLGTSTVALLQSIWYHVQFKVKIDDTVGTYEVRLDGVNVLSGSGADTRNGGNATADTIRFLGANGSGSLLDDVIIMDTSGSLNNDFPGDCKITTVFPSSNGATNDFTPSAGSNFQNVDDNPSNDDTDYNGSSTVGHIDLYNVTDVTVTGSILGVKASITYRKDDAGTREIAPVCRSTSNFVGATKTCSSSYKVDSQMYETDPNTAAAWTQANLNNAQFGTKVIT